MKPKSIIYIADTGVLADEGLFQKIYSKMPAYRRKKIDRIRSDRGKRLSLGAGYLLQLALDEFGICGDFLYVEGKGGKPYLEGRKDVFFNLSHSGERAMCIIGAAECGCDVEKIREVDKKLAQRFFSSKECECIRNADNPDEEFFRIWTLKESYVKAVGKGLSMILASFDVLEAVKDGPIPYSLHELDASDGYRYSCCIKGIESAPEIRRVSFE